jgi:methylated-DNA-[protein]-cysteine S-methyltransferase
VEAKGEGLKYAVLHTRWGWVGLLTEDGRLIRCTLPLLIASRAREHLLRGLVRVTRDDHMLPVLRAQVRAYFEGKRVDFGEDIPLHLAGLSDFTRCVLRLCRRIKYGQRQSYSQLARRLGRAGSAGSARAVGNALASNPLPVIIPCHRVVRSDGNIGGFNAAGGTRLKRRMLQMEKRVVRSAGREKRR